MEKMTAYDDHDDHDYGAYCQRMDDHIAVEVQAVGSSDFWNGFWCWIRFWFRFRTKERFDVAKEERELELGSSTQMAKMTTYDYGAWLTMDDDAVEVQAVRSSDFGIGSDFDFGLERSLRKRKSSEG